ncbi:type VII secretion protein EssB [Oceanobacillus arenosus]|uniref:Type VII secretion protein EssB n=1 Tax=Oceanobacillus arenosus TaxID=1229153 RepID=A0A3D8PLC8_9BACI|nr:type VII secretion protein EssB [Oceanobacillus arenosus]RDW16462.1 type VII secretion protein EssB [Oceanobacillus arenosus]
MKEKTIQFENVSLQFVIEKNNWNLKMPKSHTSVKDIRQMDLLKDPSDQFAPITIDDEEDSFLFSFYLDPDKKRWKQIQELNRNEKLRILCNMTKLDRYLASRINFFLHPDNLVFDDNLMPVVIYRGIRDLVPPYEMDESAFLKQFKCFIIALFSKKYTFDDLYNGSLQNAKEMEFERQVNEIRELAPLKAFLNESYKKEQKKTEKTMEVVPTKRFSLFKRLSIIMIIVSILLIIPLIYYGFINSPFQNKLLESHGEFLATDYGGVIATLEKENPENFPNQTKYILANSYINVENLSEGEKESILKNVSLKSDQNYLLYWIYNGRGQFEESLEKAKYIDDPQLIMYGLIKQIEQAKNNPELSGTERDDLVNKLGDQLNKYIEDYNLDPDEDGQLEDAKMEEENTKEQEETNGNQDANNSES